MSGENGQRVVGRDRKWWEGIGCGEKGLGEVRRGVEIGRSGRGQGAVGRGREEWGGIVGTFLPSPFLHSVNGACVLVHGDLNC